MLSMNITQARANLYKLFTQVNESSEPVTITNNRGKNCVLISEDDWNSIAETIYLNSIPGMVDSIMAARHEPLEQNSVYKPEEEW